MTPASFNSKQLVTRTLQGLDVPRVPTGPLAVHFCAGLNGVSIRDYSTNARLLAESVIKYYERFQPDAVWVSADTWVSAEAMGTPVGASSPNQPLGNLGAPLIQKPSDIDHIPRPDPSSQGRCPMMIEALERVVAALGKEVFIVACFDQYPFSLAAALMGINEIMLKLEDDRPMVEALMERCLEQTLSYGRALSDAGADLLSGGDSPAGLIGPATYRTLARPFEQRLIAGLKSATRKPVSLHMCGDATPFLTDLATTGADVLEIDYKCDITRACRTIGPGIALWGNLDPVSVLARGSVSHVQQATTTLLEAVKTCDHRRFVLSSGCTLAMETPAENLEAMLATR